MTKDEKLMQQALDALISCTYDEEGYCINPDNEDAIEALRARLAQLEPPKPATGEDLKIYESVAANYEKDRAQPEPEPVAWMYEYGTDHCDAVNKIRWYQNVTALRKPEGMVRNIVPLYTAPPQREFIGLTDEEIIAMRHMRDWTAGWTDIRYAREIEAKLKEKNNG